MALRALMTYSQRVTWTVFAILAMFFLIQGAPIVSIFKFFSPKLTWSPPAGFFTGLFYHRLFGCSTVSPHDDQNIEYFSWEKWWGRRRGRGYKWQSTSDRSWNSQKFQEWSTSIFMGSSVLPHKSILSFIATSPIYRHPVQFIQPRNINMQSSVQQRVTWDF